MYGWKLEEGVSASMNSVIMDQDLEEYGVGKRVKHDMISSGGALLIPAGTVLTREHLKLMKLHRVSIPALVHSTEDKASPIQLLINEATQYAEDLFYRIRTNRKVPLLDVRVKLIPYIQQAAEHKNIFQIIEAVKAKDNYTYKHSVGVSVVATNLGKWLGLDASEIALLTLAGLLHDVGKMKISPDLLHKPDALTEAEYVEVKRHTIYGYEMLRETAGLNPRVALVALQHHERCDGSGYPLQLKDHQIDLLSRIVAVADTFHAMSSDRPYQKAKPFYEVLEQMRKATFHGLDPHIVNVFITNLCSKLIGRTVKLTDGRHGEIIYLNPHDSLKPMVMLHKSFLDLTKERDIQIKEVIA
jgi:putative nucleotidyltransferase with HDIG domain